MQLSVEVTRPMLFLPNYCLKHLERQLYTYTFSLIHSRILMPCPRPRLLEPLIISYVTLIIIYVVSIGNLHIFFCDEKMKFGGHFCIQNFFLNFLLNNNLLMSVWKV